jgi:hypothetical protein
MAAGVCVRGAAEVALCIDFSIASFSEGMNEL